ncbi:MAG: hypothetical protein ACLFUX_07385 [Spirochaetaceae bacterium]
MVTETTRALRQRQTALVSAGFAPASFLVSAAVVVVLGFILLPAAPGIAQSRVDGEVTAINALLWDGDAQEAGLLGLGEGEFDLRSERDRNVQGRLTLRASLLKAAAESEEGAETDDGTGGPSASGAASAAVISMPRASVRFRFPVTENYSMRVTAGRDRVSWGTGRLFNAADVIFGAEGTQTADFLEITDDLRDETAWLTAFYVPLGDYAYLEPVVLPPLPSLMTSGTGEGTDGGDGETGTGGAGITGAVVAGADVPDISRTRAGGRVSFEVARFTFEPGYFYDGFRERHELVLGAAGLLGIDVYGAARLSLDEGMSAGDFTDREKLGDRSVLSLGAYHRARVGTQANVDARLEVLLRPGAAWSDRGAPDAEYALLVYPELIYTPIRTVALVGRSVISPIDRSALLSAGVNWNVFGGFDLLAFASAQAGDRDAVFAWARPGGAALLTGFAYRF